MKKISTRGMSRDKWLAARRQGLGGSDAAAVMGLNPHKSPMELYIEKTSQDTPDTSAPSEAAYWGTVLEAPVAAHYAELHPEVRVRKNNHILIASDAPFMLANVDREIHTDSGETYGLEIKTAGVNSRRMWDDGDVPPQYVVQVQHYMAVTGWPKFVVAALIGGQDYVEREIARDEEIIAAIRSKEKEFWTGVENGIAPEWDGSESAWQVLKAMYPASSGAIELPSSLREDLEAYIALDAVRKEAERGAKDLKTRIEALRQKIAAAMGSAERGTMPGFVVSYPVVNIPEKVVKPYSYRRMTIKQTEER